MRGEKKGIGGEDELKVLLEREKNRKGRITIIIMGKENGGFGGVAEWLVCRRGDPRDRGSNTRKKEQFEMEKAGQDK